MRKIFRFLYLSWSIFWFLLVMILIFPFVIIGSFFGPIRGGNFIYRLLHLWGDIWFFLAGMPTRFQLAQPHTQPPDPQKQYVFVANHVSNLDAAFLVKVIRQPFRPLGKIELVKVPVFGYIYKVAVVTVDRGDASHRSKSIRNLKSIIRKGISILIFPEGTFNETGLPLKEMYDGAFRLAIETQTPIKPVIFPDTYARMQGDKVFTLNPGVCRAIWLDEVPVEGYTLADLPRLKEQVRVVMSTALEAANASWIRVNPQG
jgi:1-acyl-sn-glycerol-3-phosphate acyltransferase